MTTPDTQNAPQDSLTAESKRLGRPRKNGVRDAGVLIRGTLALNAFQLAREQGVKYEVALNEAVDAVRKKFPTEKISATEVKRMLAEFMPRNGEEQMVVTEKDGVYGIGFQPKKIYPKPRSSTPKKG